MISCEQCFTNSDNLIADFVTEYTYTWIDKLFLKTLDLNFNKNYGFDSEVSMSRVAFCF